ncbi:MAG: hypothetical protein Q7S92_03650 [Candidatus Diapherotrites archaeon]|nr:hypothetical protein [Candidatus Diapherotrites archaeon]
MDFLEKARDIILQVDAFLIAYIFIGNNTLSNLSNQFIQNIQHIFVFSITLIAIEFALFFLLKQWQKNKNYKTQIIAYMIGFGVLTLILTYINLKQ